MPRPKDEEEVESRDLLPRPPHSARARSHCGARSLNRWQHSVHLVRRGFDRAVRVRARVKTVESVAAVSGAGRTGPLAVVVRQSCSASDVQFFRRLRNARGGAAGLSRLPG